MTRPSPALTGRHVVVLGMGRSGQAAARLLLARGAEVTGADLRTGLELPEGVEPALGPHDEALFTRADLVVASPGVPQTAPPLVAARAAGVPVWGELGLAAALLRDEQDLPLAAVTGTNGKSTVVHLLGQLLEQAGLQPFVGGNLGRPLSELLLGNPARYRTVVVEVSSYQLELPGGLAPKAAAVLNLAPDHLGRHGDMATYAAAKRLILQRVQAGGEAWFPPGLPILDPGIIDGKRRYLGSWPGVVDQGGHLDFSGGSDDGLLSTEGYPLPGAHNRANLAAATALALAMGALREQLDPTTLRGLPHRLELVARGAGLSWVNDSKATNVDAALVGIAAFTTPLVVMLGGQPKEGDDYRLLRQPLSASAHTIVTFGEAGPAIAKALEGLPLVTATTLGDAVSKALASARKGDTVLLSPACSSFDEFTDFEARGVAFTALAREACQAAVSRERP